MGHRTLAVAAVATMVVAGGCGLFRLSSRPPHASEAEAQRVRFPAFIPEERTVVDGRTLRAAALAMDEFLPEPAPPLPDDADPLSRCLARRDSYDVLVWGGGGANEPAADGGAADPDAGASASSSSSEGQDVIFVTIFLRGGACPEGDSPVVDAGETYAIDVVNWRILAVKH
jgi:hypothetical protein